MNLLLDTHIWLWSLLEPEKLSRRVSRELEHTANQLWLSPISIWELLILCEKRRVVLAGDASSWIRTAMQVRPLQEAPLSIEVALETQKIRLPHRDPADRFLAATARVFQLTLVTADQHLIACAELSVLANR